MLALSVDACLETWAESPIQTHTFLNAISHSSRNLQLLKVQKKSYIKIYCEKPERVRENFIHSQIIYQSTTHMWMFDFICLVTWDHWISWILILSIWYSIFGLPIPPFPFQLFFCLLVVFSPPSPNSCVELAVQKVKLITNVIFFRKNSNRLFGISNYPNLIRFWAESTIESKCKLPREITKKNDFKFSLFISSPRADLTDIETDTTFMHPIEGSKFKFPNM